MPYLEGVHSVESCGFGQAENKPVLQVAKGGMYLV